MPKKRIRALTAQQEAFCQHYTKHWNATRAAREAKYNTKNPHVMGYQLLQNPLVQERIDHLKSHALKEIGITRERVLTELSRIAFTSMRDLASWSGGTMSLRSSDEISEDVAAAVSEVSETVSKDGGSIKIKQHDKVRALELLGKYQKIFTERLEHSGPDGKPIETKAVGEMPSEQIEARIKALLEKRGSK